MLALDGNPGTTGRPFQEAVAEACELKHLIHAPTDTLVTRGLYLVDRVDELVAIKRRAARTGVGYTDALRAVGSAQMERAAIEEELGLRGVALLAEYRLRRLS
jgi:hypothetical protein